MDKILSAEEWFKKLEDEFLLGSPKSELNKKCKTRNQLIHYAIESYSTYLLEAFAGEVKSESYKLNDKEKRLTPNLIDQLLTKFKEKL